MTFEAADALAAGFAFGLAPVCVFDGSRVVEHVVGGYPPKRVVGLAVTTAVETVPNCLALRGLDGTGAA